MAKAYYGAGSTGAVPGFEREPPAPVTRLGLIQGYGAPSYSGGGQAYRAGPLPPQGMALDDGTVIFGTYMGNGQIQGQVRLPDGRMVSGSFPLDPMGRSLDPGALQQAMSSQGSGGAGGGDASDRERQLGFDALRPGQGYFAGPLGRQTESSLMARQQGVDAPYTQAVQDRLFARQADLNAGQEAGQQDRIRASFNDRGMGGSGGELMAMLGAGRERGAANTAAETEISNRAALENFGARERAGQASTDFLQSRSSSEAPYRLKEADARFGFSEHGQDAGGGLGALAGLLGLGGGRISARGQPQPPMGPQVNYQSSADVMRRAGANVQGMVNGGNSSAFQRPTPAYNTPTQSLVTAWDMVGGRDALGLGGNPMGGVMGPGSGYSYVNQIGGAPTVAPAVDWTKIQQASGVGGISNVFRSGYGG